MTQKGLIQHKTKQLTNQNYTTTDITILLVTLSIILFLLKFPLLLRKMFYIINTVSFFCIEPNSGLQGEQEG